MRRTIGSLCFLSLLLPACVADDGGQTIVLEPGSGKADGATSHMHLTPSAPSATIEVQCDNWWFDCNLDVEMNVTEVFYEGYGELTKLVAWDIASRGQRSGVFEEKEVGVWEVAGHNSTLHETGNLEAEWIITLTSVEEDPPFIQEVVPTNIVSLEGGESDQEYFIYISKSNWSDAIGPIERVDITVNAKAE